MYISTLCPLRLSRNGVHCIWNLYSVHTEEGGVCVIRAMTAICPQLSTILPSESPPAPLCQCSPSQQCPHNGCTIVHFGERTIESLVRRICHCNRVLSAGKVYNRSSVVMIQNVFDDKVHDREIFSKYFTRKLHNRFQWIG